MNDGKVRYAAWTDTADVTVQWRLFGLVEIRLVSNTSEASWIVTADEARQIAIGIVTVIR